MPEGELNLTALILSGLALSILSIFGVGVAIVALGRRYRLFGRLTACETLILAAALGVYWATIFVTGAFLAGSAFSTAIAVVKLAADGAIVAIALAVATSEFRSLARTVLHDPTLVGLVLFGVAFGLWGTTHFLAVPDSIQVYWTQQWLDGQAVEFRPLMLGFTGVIAPQARFYDHLPVITSSAAFKPVLGAIVALSCYYSVEALKLKPLAVNAILLVCLTFVSQFGQAMLMLGKDSLFGVAFSIVFFASLMRKNAIGSSIAPAIYFSAAAATGMIAVPYMAAAFAIWLIVAGPIKRPWRLLPSILTVGLPIIPFSIAGFAGIPAWQAALGYGALAAAVWGLSRRPPRHPASILIPILSFTHRARAGLPIVFAASSTVLMPATLSFLVWRDTVEVRPPLDGKTSFFEYLFPTTVQSWTITVGTIAALVLPSTPLGRRNSGLVAAATMPFAVLFVCLVHVHLGLGILSGFNIWDLVKDIPQWYGGPLFGLFALVGFNQIALLIPSVLFRQAAAAISGIVLLAMAVRGLDFGELSRPLTRTPSGGWSDPDMARVSDTIWRKLRKRPIYADSDLAITRSYFYTFQMYGAGTTTLFKSVLLSADILVHGPVGLLIRRDKMRAVIAFANQNDARVVRYARHLEQRQGLFVGLEANTLQDGTDAEDQVVVREGGYGEELAEGVRFQWMQGEAEVIILGNGRPLCLVVEMFRADSNQEVRLGGPQGVQFVDLLDTTIHRRAVIKMPIPAAPETSVFLSALEPDRRFPNDPRKISYGLKMPIKLDPFDTCSDSRTAAPVAGSGGAK